jgi:hypothetical protein
MEGEVLCDGWSPCRRPIAQKDSPSFSPLWVGLHRALSRITGLGTLITVMQ